MLGEAQQPSNDEAVETRLVEVAIDQDNTNEVEAESEVHPSDIIHCTPSTASNSSTLGDCDDAGPAGLNIDFQPVDCYDVHPTDTQAADSIDVATSTSQKPNDTDKRDDAVRKVQGRNNKQFDYLR